MVIARGIITIHHVVDIVSTTWYYKLQASTASAPAKPTTQTPSGWSTTEPAYTEGSTNSLYIVQKTTFSDGTFDYSDVSLSSSYEAAKAAYNKAVLAQTSADAAQESVDNLEIGGRNLLSDTTGERYSPGSVNDSAYITPSYIYTDFGQTLLNNTEDTFTYSFDYEVTENESNTGYIYTQMRGSQIAGGTSTGRDLYVLNQPTGKYCCVFKLNATQASGTAISAGIRLRSATDGAILKVWNVKLEKGNKPTTWTPAPEDTQADIDALQPELIVGTHGTTATATWTGTSTVLTEIKAGTRIQYKLSSAGASNVTLNLTLKNGTTTGAKNVYFLNTTRLGTQYGVNATIDLIYDGSAWRVLNPYTNSNTVGTYGGAVKAGANGVKNYSLVMRDTETTWVSLTTTAGTGTSKARYTGGLYPDRVLYMGSNSEYASGKTTGTCYEALGLNLQYSTNCGSTLTAGKAVYLVGELHSDGLFYLDSVWWTQTLPTTENGKTYIYLGLAYSTSNIYLTPENTLYQFYEGKFRKLSEIEEMKAAKTATNYIYDSQALGLIVAREAPASDSDVSTIGWHTRQTADGFDVYYNSTRVAHYGDEVWIGAGGRKIKISDNGYRIDRGNTNLMYAGLSEANVLITKSEKWWTARNDTIYSSIYDSGETITMGSTIASWAVQAIKNVYLSGKPDTPPICLVRGENYTVGSDKSITLKAADTEDADDPMMLYLQDVPDRFGDTDEYHFTASFVVEYTTAAQADYFQFGENSENNGLDALAQGIGCEAGGSYSAAQGDHVKASNVGETAVGRYNESGPDVMFNVGCGTDDNNRKSALMVYGDGKTRMRQILAEDIVAETGAIDALQASSIYGTGGTLTVPTKLEVLKSDTGVVTKAGSVTIQDINSVVRKSGWARLQYSFKANAAIAAWTTVGTTDMFSRPAAAVRCYSNGRFWQITTAGNIQPTSALTSGETYIVEAVYPIRDYTT